jgi:hypothetical protein
MLYPVCNYGKGRLVAAVSVYEKKPLDAMFLEGYGDVHQNVNEGGSPE